MGNKLLRPDPQDQFAPFTDDQKFYLKEKFECLCDQRKLLSAKQICTQLHASIEQANKIINYIDFEGKGQVDFYQFMCAAASLHQDDQQAQQFLFDIFKSGNQMDQSSFDAFFATVFNYLKFMSLITQDYTPETGAIKFKQYDFNANGSISLEQFRLMLVNDVHCSKWMQTLGFAQEKIPQKNQKPLNHQIPNEDFVVDDSKGDEAGSTPSWIKTAQHMGAGQTIIKRSQTPSQTLDINYVYGYRSYDTRSNLKYNSNSDVVYHTAACGIILNKLKNSQKINTQHSDDITCLDINTKKNLIATGQMGRKPCIVLWDTISGQTKAVFKGKLEKSIGCVAISLSGRYVAATSMGDGHQIAVYDVQEKTLVAFGKGPKSVIYQIKFTQNQDQIVCVCSKEVVFAKFSKGKLQLKKGIFGKAPCVPCTGVALLQSGNIIVSMSNGLLTQWKGTSCTKIFKQHSKPVTALCQRGDGGIISGDSQGNIIIWNQNMSKQRQIIDIKKLLGNVKLNNPKIISLCQQYSNILIGTRGGQIIQISKGSATILIQGHFDQQLWGLAINNSKNQFYTGGQDKLLYKWDITKRKVIDKKKLQSAINFLDYSRQNILAVGMKNGIVNFFDASTLKLVNKVCQHKNPDKDMISVVKFSPDGSKVAIGYSPPYSVVYIYDYNNLSAKPKVCKGSPSRINSIDFSRSGSQIMINNTSYEILFYDASNGSQVTSATKFKGQQWATLTARFSWSTQGIWPACSDGSDINSVDRSNSKKFLATADDFSMVKVFDYPVAQNKQIYNTYKGHSSHVTGIKWSYDDKFLISTGGLQKSIIQWSNTLNEQIKYEIQEPIQQQEKKPLQNDDEQYQFDAQGQDQSEKQVDDDDFQVDSNEGDQSMAVKPFEGQVKASTPAQYKISNQKNIAPNESLNIKHVWGLKNEYITDRVRNQVKYSSNYKSCVFITAALGVEMNLASKSQTFYKGQSEDLISFAISKDRKICATGQMAELNKGAPKSKIVDVHVWDLQQKKLLANLTKFHQRGIVLVEFSPSGQKILTVGQDDKNSLAVYDWKNQRLAWSSPVCGAKVTAAAWKSQTQYITVGLKHVKLWSGAKGTTGKTNATKWDPMLSAVYWKDKFVTGGTSGAVYLWNGNVAATSKGHNGRVDCFSIDSNGNLYSGDSKGIILSWKITGGKLNFQKEILNVSTIDRIDPGVLSIDFSPDNKFLIGTNSSSIYQISGKNSKVIMNSHCKGQLWAESWSPDNKQFVTAGDDKIIRIYDAQTYEQKSSCLEMKEQVRGIDWQKSKGQLIVAGDYKGKIYLFSKQLKLLCQRKTKFSKTKPRKQPYWIQDIKFSPNGQYVAFGAHGGASHVQIFEVTGESLSQKSKIIDSVFSSALLSLDWTQQSDRIGAISQSYQLQFMSIDSKVSASSLRDAKWASWSGKFGYQVKQIHQDVMYSKINSVTVSPSKSLVVSGSDDQKIRLFNFPVNIPKQKFKQFTGHSSHICKVRFSLDEQYLLSVGGNDRTIILWQVQGREKSKPKAKIVQEDSEQEQVEEFEGDDGDQDDIRVPKAREEKFKVQEEELDDFAVEQDQGDQFMATKPWLGAIKQPTQAFYKSKGNAPSISLQLQYAHGYRVKDCRNNLKYIRQGLIAYHTAGLGIIKPSQGNTKTQTFFDLHSDDIISFYQSPLNRQVFYTGQMGAKPIIYSWSSQGKKLSQFKGAKKGVSALAANSQYLVAAGLDDNHQVYLWNVKTGKLIGSDKGGKDVIIAMQWVGDSSFVSIGLKHFKIWQISGATVKGATGAFGKNCNLLCSVVVKDKNIYCGASDGSLQLWNDKSCVKSVKLHQSAIHALCVGESVLLTGSSDGNIKILKISDLSQISTVNCIKILQNSVKPSIRALDIWQNKILIGTLGSEIYEVISNEVIDNSSSEGKFKMNSKLMSGHYAPNTVTNQVWGLASYDPTSYITCADDGTVRIWDLNKKEQLTRFDLQFDSKLKSSKGKVLPDSAKGRCLAVSQDNWVVVGCKDGTLKIVDDHLKPRFSGLMNKNKKEISQIKFSPDGRLLAVGDHTGFISIYQWNNGSIKLKSRKIKHNSYIKHLDFSRDSNIIHSTCGSYQLLFWNAQTGSQITSGATQTRNQEWATWNVTLGWPVQGIFQLYMDGTDVNAVDRSIQSFGNKGMKLLASGDDRGKVRILEYPCVEKNSKSVKGNGHSSHVTNVKWMKNDQVVLSTGGEDQTILQWKCQFLE